MELRQLRYFVKLAEVLNFTHAANAIYISQSAMSQQIFNLEQELNVVLFHRTKRTVELTQSGQIFLVRARNILSEIDKLKYDLRDDISSVITFNLSLGFDMRIYHNEFFKKNISNTIFSLRKSFSRLHVTFNYYEHENLIQSLIKGDVDLAFFLYHQCIPKENFQLTWQILQQDEMALTLCSDLIIENNTPPEKACSIMPCQELVLLEKDKRGLSQIMQIMDELKIKPSIRLVSSPADMYLLLESGECATIMPLSYIKQIKNEYLKFFRLNTPAAPLYYLAAWKNTNSNPLITDLIQSFSPLLSVLRG